MLSSKTNALLTHTIASFWRKQSCLSNILESTVVAIYTRTNHIMGEVGCRVHYMECLAMFVCVVVSGTAQNNVQETTVNWLPIEIALAADGLRTMRLNSVTLADLPRDFNKLAFILNFGTIGWKECPRRLSDGLPTTIEGKQKIKRISFSRVMTGCWFHYRIRTFRRQWWWKIFCPLI